MKNQIHKYLFLTHKFIKFAIIKTLHPKYIFMMKEEINSFIASLYPLVYEDSVILRKSLKSDSEKYDRMPAADPNKKILYDKLVKDFNRLKRMNNQVDNLFDTSKN